MTYETYETTADDERVAVAGRRPSRRTAGESGVVLVVPVVRVRRRAS
jgi:hypothetical protein